MIHLKSILMQPACQALGWALLHFCWQGTLVALAMAGCKLTLRNSPARVRYTVNCLCLVLLLALPLLTLAVFVSQTSTEPVAGGWKGTAALVIPPASHALAPGSLQRSGIQESIAPWLPWIVAVWISGVILLSIRWFGAWTYLRRLRRPVSLPIPPEWQRTLEDLKRRAAVSAPVRLCVSGLTQVPCVLGWLRPIIFMPAAAVTGLDQQALEALLAHELAHIRRHDYLVNLLQTVADTLLFYHPAVWWVSSEIRIERENCCDDIAAEICGDRLSYARTLVNLEQTRAGSAAFALSAGGGSLMHRIQRLLQGAGTMERRGAAWPSALAGVAIVACVLASLHPALRASGGAPQINYDRPGSRQTLLASAMASPATQASPAPPAPAPPVEKSEDFLTGIAAAGFHNLTVEQLIELKIHGVTPDFAVAVKQAGFANVTPAELIELRIHGVDADFIRAFKAAGDGNLSIDDLVSLHIHGVTPDFIAEMKSAGYSGLSMDQYRQLRISGVDAGFIRHLNEHGMHNLSVQQLIRLKRAGI
jgi:beta-lactamase regulating signal transducer with metallopeptidase domain